MSEAGYTPRDVADPERERLTLADAVYELRNEAAQVVLGASLLYPESDDSATWYALQCDLECVLRAVVSESAGAQ